MRKIIKVYIKAKDLTKNFHTHWVYQTGKSGDATLHNLVRSLERSLHNKKVSLAAFLDNESVLNNILMNSFNLASSRRKKKHVGRYQNCF